MKAAVNGSRACDVSLEHVMEQMPGECSLILSGGAKGIHRLAAHVGCELWEIRPDNRRYGAKAPLVRNLELVGQADAVLGLLGHEIPRHQAVHRGLPQAGHPHPSGAD